MAQTFKDFVKGRSVSIWEVLFGSSLCPGVTFNTSVCSWSRLLCLSSKTLQRGRRGPTHFNSQLFAAVGLVHFEQ